MRVPAISGSVLGLQVYRGFASLSRLAEISRADEFHQETNPLGTQRDIRLGQALAAYEYTTGAKTAFFPEIVLNARDPKMVRFQPVEPGSALGFLEIDEIVAGQPRVVIARIDGNHRLHFGGGDKSKHLPPIDKETSFCLIVGLTQEQEASLFLDINSNQRGMDTSHLDNLRFRLTPEPELLKEHFHLYVAEHLSEDVKGPFLGIIHKGGRRSRGGTERSQGMKRIVSLRSLGSAIERLLRRSRCLGALPKVEVQYPIIRKYWSTVREVFHKDWDQKESLLLKGIGITAMAIVGADIIDRCIIANDTSSKRMAEYLTAVDRIADWSKEGAWSGCSGLQGVEMVAAQLREGLVRAEDLHGLMLSLAKD